MNKEIYYAIVLGIITSDVVRGIHWILRDKYWNYLDRKEVKEIIARIDDATKIVKKPKPIPRAKVR